MSDDARLVRLLLLADSHLGFDHPLRPKIKRRRRGHDFLGNYQRALQAAIEEPVDLVVHGGDVFHAPTVPQSLVYQAFEPLKEVASAGIPVLLVPGNHERSRIPFDWLAHHPDIHVFQEPGTVRLDLAGVATAVTGIPCVRRGAQTRFPHDVGRARWAAAEADLRLLVAHQAFEGAVVGPSDFTFRNGADVVRLADVPPRFAAVLSGHIHRSQVLTTDLRGHPCPAPVFYPGSLERTAYAERREAKGFMVLELAPSTTGGSVMRWEFRDIGARPMEIRPLRVRGLSADGLERELRKALASVPEDAVLRLEADDAPQPDARSVLAAERLRRLAPATMNVEIVIPGLRQWKSRRPSSAGATHQTGSATPPKRPEPPDQQTLF